MNENFTGGQPLDTSPIPPEPPYKFYLDGTIKAFKNNEEYLAQQRGPELAADIYNLCYILGRSPEVAASLNVFPENYEDTVERLFTSADFVLGQDYQKPPISFPDLKSNPTVFGLSPQDVGMLREFIFMYREVIRSHERTMDASIDKVTELFNRKAWETRSLVLLEQFMRLDGQDNYLVLGLMDVDLFKSVNDSYGHAVGDRVLTKIGRRMKKRIRKGDIAGRFGGDEIALTALSGKTKPGDLKELYEGKRQEVVRPISIDGGKEITVTQSWGLAILSHDDLKFLMADSSLEPEQEGYYQELFNRIIKIADQALYRAKEDGRNCLRTNTDSKDQSKSSSPTLPISP